MRMDRDLFTKLAEDAHAAAETNLRTFGHLIPVVLLYDRDASMTPVVVWEDLDEECVLQLRQLAAELGAVAAIWVATAYALDIPAGMAEQPIEDMPLPSESPAARMMLISQARWPDQELFQVRTTDVGRDDSGQLVLTRDPSDPDRSVMRDDVLAQVFTQKS